MFRWIVALSLLAGSALADIRVVDGDTMDVGDVRYRINGIDAPEAGQTCKDARGRNWDCGKAATATLAQLIRGRIVRCDPITADGYGRVVARCFADGRDLAEAMVLGGMAWAFVKFSDEYAGAQDRARAERRGIWQGQAVPAWDYRESQWAAAVQDAPEGCPIKGNISSSGRIYHTPWSPWYKRTRINTAKGERWFCDEAEAIAAGWRAPVWR